MKKRYGIPIWFVLGLCAALLAAYIALPYVVRDYLNDKLADMGDYQGHISDVDLALWRGAYRINGLEIVKIDGQIPVPFVDAPSIDLSVSWHSLWYDRAVVATVEFAHPTLNFVDGGDNNAASQTGQGTDWHEQLDKLLPITLNELRVVEGTIRFHNFTSKPPVELEATQVNASLYNLTNVTDEQGKRVARFEGTAKLLGNAPLETQASFDPFKDFEDFDLKLRVTDIELKQLNDFSGAYGNFDFNAGTADVVIEASANAGQLGGYIKPLLRNVDIFNWQQDVANQDKGFFRSLWEALVGGSETVLKNQGKDQFATRIELSGNVHQQETSGLQAFFAILRNAFVEAFNARFENSSQAEPVTK